MAVRDDYREAARAECGEMTREELLDRIGFLMMRHDQLTQRVTEAIRRLDDLYRNYQRARSEERSTLGLATPTETETGGRYG